LSPASTADARGPRPFRFGPRARLATAADFDRVFREGQRSSDQIFTVLFLPNGGAHARLGFAVSRQRVRRAVHRNRLRRLVREHFRTLDPPLPPVDIVVLARDAAAAASNPAITASIDSHWARVRRRVAPSTGA
jgi:ribonuclease P protein component